MSLKEARIHKVLGIDMLIIRVHGLAKTWGVDLWSSKGKRTHLPDLGARGRKLGGSCFKRLSDCSWRAQCTGGNHQRREFFLRLGDLMMIATAFVYQGVQRGAWGAMADGSGPVAVMAGPAQNEVAAAPDLVSRNTRATPAAHGSSAEPDRCHFCVLWLWHLQGDAIKFEPGWTCLCGQHSTVNVEARTWANINKHGGVGRIVKYNGGRSGKARGLSFAPHQLMPTLIDLCTQMRPTPSATSLAVARRAWTCELVADDHTAIRLR